MAHFELSDSFSVRLPDFARTTTFRWTLAIAGAFVLGTLVLFGFVYWQTAAYMTSNIDGLLTQELRIIAAAAPERRSAMIDDRLRLDPRRIRVVGLFGTDGHRIAGNMESLPSGISPNVLTNAQVVRVDNRGRETQNVRLAARLLASGEVLVISRDIDELAEIAEIVQRALALGLLLAFGLAVALGIVLSLRALDRLSQVNQRIQRIVAGELRERLPTRGNDDPFDQLAVSVNRMLDEIETLIHEIAGVGDNIAHDLRTPLTRVRVGLQRGRANARTLEESQAVLDRAVSGLDQSLAIVTALLRIAEIEHNQRRSGFGKVALAQIVREVCDLYEPIAEEKRVTLQVSIRDEPTVQGDRDLLLETIANLLDNAVKFTPEGGRVQLALIARDGESIVRVSDTGPGVTEDEREIVLRRFYRSDRSRQTQGVGLGLSLVAAIIKLHGFRLTISVGPGCVVQIVCPRA